MQRDILAALLFSAISSAALAQQQLPFGGEVVIPPSQTVYASTPPRTGYQPRVLTDIYDNISLTFMNGTGATFAGSCNQILEDVSFVGGPWALPYSGPRVITGCSLGVTIEVIPTDSATDRLFAVFWDTNDVNFEGFTGSGTNMIRPGASPLGAYLFDLGALPAGFAWHLAFSGLNVTVPPAANGIVVQAGWLKTAAGVPTDWSNLSGLLRESCPNANDRGLAFGSNTLFGPGGNPASVGSTLPDFGRDILAGTNTGPSGACTDAGRFIGTPGEPATTGSNEHRQMRVTPEGGSLTQYGYQLSLQGDVQNSIQPFPLGSIGDNGTSFQLLVGTSSVRWCSFTIAGDATDAALQFLDLDTEGSTTDVAIGLYDDTAHLLATDDNSGSGTNAQLSFGVGRRPAIGDGKQYDGRSGQLPAGIYYVGIALGGSLFQGGYSIVPAQGPAAEVSLNFHTNVNGSPLAPSVPPIIAAGHDFDALFGPVDPDQPGGAFRQLTPADTGVGGVIWDRFTLASAIDAAHFLNLIASQSTLFAPALAYIFDAGGNIVYSDGPNAFPKFIIGGPGPNTPPEATAGLPAGTYYLASVLSPADDLRSVTSGQRWHVRGRNLANATLSPSLFAGRAGPPCNPDTNHDGVADQGDVDYLINVIAGGPNPTHISPDFNNDGASDQGDVDALINVVAGGPCP
ncbi:MAG: hypothetical protein GC200_11160 [Tepidisphaera sp.]|nr:hypothetical protein [Tepidisphaera sp.]